VPKKPKKAKKPETITTGEHEEEEDIALSRPKKKARTKAFISEAQTNSTTQPTRKRKKPESAEDREEAENRSPTNQSKPVKQKKGSAKDQGTEIDDAKPANKRRRKGRRYS